jgi:phenylpropionate dioxygenase-like ring-hydroxylating dioxygenase large terminal subunit
MDDTERALLRSSWLPVARVEDIGDNGVAQAAILGVPLVVFRAAGVTTVADAACPHRGAALWMGTVRDGTLECPYHGWRFAARIGACTRAPSLPAGAPPPRVALRTYPVREAYGHVWACLDEPLLDLPTLPSDVDNTWEVAAGVPIDVHCGVRQITENFRDPAHFPFVHAESLGPDVPQEVDPYQVRRDGWRLTWDVTFPTPDDEDPDAVLGPLHYAVTLPAFTSVVLDSPHDGVRRLICQAAVPTTADGNQVRIFWFIGHEPVASTAEVYLSVAERLAEETRIFAEDCRVVAALSPAEAPLALDTQVHTRADRFSLAYRRTYRELLDVVAARPSPTCPSPERPTASVR